MYVYAKIGLSIVVKVQSSNRMTLVSYGGDEAAGGLAGGLD